MKRVVEIWRDKDQSKAGLPVLWVVYCVDGIEGNLECVRPAHRSGSRRSVRPHGN